MKNFTATLAFCLLLISAAFAQDGFTPPDYDAIEKATSDKDSKFYYPKLFKRYKDNDTTLDNKEFRMLYFGYFYHDPSVSNNNMSFLTSGLNDSIRVYKNRDSLNKEEYKKLLSWTSSLLEANPFDLRKLYDMAELYSVLGDSVAAKPYIFKVRQLLRTITSTGDGLTCNTAYHVTAISHEYFVLSVFGFQSSGQTLTQDQCDYHKLADNQEGLEGLYFDVKQLFMGYSRMFKDVKPTVPQNKKAKKKKSGK